MIHLIWHLNRHSVARTSGRVWREVNCRCCQQVYFHEVECQVVERVGTPFGLDQETADEDARLRAELVLRRQLATAVRPVPCPHCARYQPDMVALLRAQRGWWLLALGWGLVTLAATVFALGFTWVLFELKPGAMPSAEAVGVVAGGPLVLGAVGGLALLVRFLRSAGYDPNSDEYDIDRRTAAERMALTPVEFTRLRSPDQDEDLPA